MNAEYQRLEAEASEVQKQIDELVKACGQMAATDFHRATKGTLYIVDNVEFLLCSHPQVRAIASKPSTL